MSAQNLFQPFELKSLKLKNRIAMAPMTRSHSPGGVATDEVAAYYARRAAADVGLIISEGTGIDRPASLNDPNVPRFHGEDELAAWRKVINQVHAAHGAMGPQLWHVGGIRGSKDWSPPAPLESPSGLNRLGVKVSEGMSEEEIEDAIEAYAAAAAEAQKLGFDCVEIHAAHGYLIDQFFWEETNTRPDIFGGKTLVERSRFAIEILKAIRKAVTPDFVVIIRVSQWKQQDYEVKLANSPEEIDQWLNPLIDAGADMIHCSQRRFWEPEFDGSDLNFAGWAKKVTGAPTITVGSVGLTGEFIAAYRGESSQVASLDELLRRFDRGDFDLVAVGRALLQDPLWAQKVKEGREDELMNFTPEALKTLS